jgi:Fe-S-cluster containining protein
MAQETARGKNFIQFCETNPCDGCPAYCCKTIIIPYDAPLTFMQMDYILVMLGFPHVKMLITRDGEWKVKIERDCTFFDPENSLCTLHNPDKKPKTCSAYNAYNCWYKRNFAIDRPPDIIQFDLASFKKMAKHVSFSDDGNIVTIPSWDNLREIQREGG